MKKCMIIPDSFKGTMSAVTVSEIIEEVILDKCPGCMTETIPFSDGGEGMVDCLLKAKGGKKIILTVTGPFGMPVESFYGLSGDIAFIEMAAAAGMVLSKEKKDPLNASTYGVGELVCDAIQRGCKKIIIGLGGSCTNDAGAGMAAALGAVFYDEQGNSFIPTGGTLSKVEKIDLNKCRKTIEGVDIVALCDVENPLYGRNGAAYVFAPQKGADSDDVKYLDMSLKKFANTMVKFTGVKTDHIPGAGAAGGMGAGVLALLGGQLKKGATTILEVVDFEERLQGCDFIITGEGSLDHQSFYGKAIAGITEKAHKNRVPVIAVVGKNKVSYDSFQKAGILRAFETSAKRNSFDEIVKFCKEDLRTTTEQIVEEVLCPC